MKKLLILFCILTTRLLTAQGTIEKTVGQFSTLKVYDLIEVTMVKSDANKVVIAGKNADAVNVVNKNGKLKIKMKLKEIFDGNSTTVELYYTNIETIDANEGAKVNVDGTIEQFEIEMKTQEGGSVRADLNVTYANIRSVSGGKIELSGKAKNQEISLYTGGIYEGEDCKSVNSEVAIRAAGEAYVNASELLKIKIRAGGDVHVYGNPKRIDENKVFGGRVFKN